LLRAYDDCVASEEVRIWRPPGDDRVLLMAGTTTRYAIEPRGEYVFGCIVDGAMRSRRGRERRLVGPGRLVAWDPSGAHAGSAVEGRAWLSRLIVVEAGDLSALTRDGEHELPAEIEFPDPVVTDPGLMHAFVRLHRAFEAPATRLERDELLSEWLRGLIDRSAARRRPRPPLSPRDDRALARAREYLADLPARNVGLDELAAAAGIGKFRLVHLFREHTGSPPHAFHLARRLRIARRLLEGGSSIAEVAQATGFADQSHLHRHFRRSLGVTPGQYRRRFVRSEASRPPHDRPAPAVRLPAWPEHHRTDRANQGA
jgi:AraC-like DNA-binding protein